MIRDEKVSLLKTILMQRLKLLCNSCNLYDSSNQGQRNKLCVCGRSFHCTNNFQVRSDVFCRIEKTLVIPVETREAMNSI